MQKTALQSVKTDSSIKVSDLRRFADGWLLDGEIRQHSQATLRLRRLLIDKLTWFLDENKIDRCDVMALRQFFAYVTRTPSGEVGRWDNPQKKKAIRPCTVRTYYVHIRPFFNWLVDEGLLGASPIDSVPTPKARSEQIKPFTETQVTGLLNASRKTVHPKRDEAIVSFLLDTGVRASELCGLCMSDLDLNAKCCVVLGKGNHHRTVYFGRSTAKLLWNYLKEANDRQPTTPVFLSDRGTRSGDPLTRSGLLQLVERLGKVAKVEVTRCSPHTFRHTFAISFLRNGGNVFSLQQLLGHTDLKMTNKYVALAQADIENQHRQFSPVDRIRRSK